jgi:hypothetical protein
MFKINEHQLEQELREWVQVLAKNRPVNHAGHLVGRWSDLLQFLRIFKSNIQRH